jgi:hypothetical protein
MGLLAQLLDVRAAQSIKKPALRGVLNRIVKENKDIAKAVRTLQAAHKNRDQAIVEVISRNPAAHAALIEALLHRPKS